MVSIFGHNLFSLRHVLDSERRAILSKVLRRDAEGIESSLRGIVRDYYSLFESLSALNVKAPAIIGAAASVVLTADVVHGLEEDAPDAELLRRHMTRARQWGIALDSEQIGPALYVWLMRKMRKICEVPDDSAEMERVCEVLALFLDEFKWHISLYEAQNLCYVTWNRLRREQPRGPELREAFRKLGRTLRFSDEILK